MHVTHIDIYVFIYKYTLRAKFHGIYSKIVPVDKY